MNQEIPIHLNPDPFLSLEEVAADLNIHIETVRRWIRDGRIEAFKIGQGRTSPYRIRRSALDKYIRTCKPMSRPEVDGIEVYFKLQDGEIYQDDFGKVTAIRRVSELRPMEWQTVEEAATLLGIDIPVIRRMMADGKIRWQETVGATSEDVRRDDVLVIKEALERWRRDRARRTS